LASSAARARRAGSALAAAVLVALGGMLLSPVTGRAATPAVQITAVRSAWGGTLHQGAWVPVEIGLRAGVSDFDGRVVVSVSPPNGGQGQGCYPVGPNSTVCRGGSFNGGGASSNVEYEQPVVLAAGVAKTVMMTILPGQSTVDVRVEDGGGSVVASTSTDLDVSSNAGRAVVAVVSPDSGAFDGLGAAHLPTDSGVTVVHLKAADLPGSGTVMAGFDMVVFDGAATDTLSSDQRQALSDYVTRGGSLLITGGADAKATLAGLPPGLAPVTLEGTTRLADLGSYAAAFDLPALAGPLVASSVQPHGAVAIREHGLPLLTTGSYGAGQVAFLAVDPSAEPLRSWSGTPALMRQLLVRGTRMGGGTGSSVQLSKFGRGSQVHDRLAGENGILSGAVLTVPGVTLPDPAWLGGLLAGYVVLVGPMAYVFLRRLRRRDLLWVAVPVIAGVATFLAYTTGLGATGRNLALTEVRVLQLTPGSSRATVDSFATVYAPHGGTHSMQLLGDPAVTSLPGADQSILTVHPGDSPEQVDVHTDIATLRGWSGTRAGAVQGGVQVALHFDGTTVKGTVSNGLASDLTDVHIGVQGRSVGDLGTLRRGATQTINVSLPSSSGIVPLINGGSCFNCEPGLGMSAADREQYLRNQVASDLQAVAAVSGQDAPVLVGVATDPLLPADVQGEGVDQRPVDAVVVPLPVQVDRSQAMSNAAATLVDLDAASSDTLSSSTGDSAVYEASFPGGPSAWRNVSASFDTSCTAGVPCPVSVSINGFGGSGGAVRALPVPVPGSSLTTAPEVQVFDMVARRWVDAQTSPGSSGGLSFSLPDPRRDMDGDGNVWVRLVGINASYPGALTFSANRAGSST